MNRVFPAALSLVIAAAAFLTGCDRREDLAASTAGNVELAGEHQSYAEFDNWVVHFRAFSASELPPDVARSYNIARSANRAVLNVVILEKNEFGLDRPITGKVTASANNLTGQSKSLDVREVIEPGDGDIPAGIYYIAETTVANRETLIFSLDVTPDGATESYPVRIKQQFYHN